MTNMDTDSYLTMTLFGLAIREARSRWVHTTTAVLTVAMGAALVVGMISMLESYRESIAVEVRRMGPSAVVIPDGLETSDFLMGKHRGFVLPLEYVDRILAVAQGTDVTVEPRLVYDHDAGGDEVYLAGVARADLLAPGLRNGVNAGWRAAEYLRLSSGTSFDMFDRSFVVEKVLSERGTDDDITVFFNLGVLQGASKRGELISEIRVFSGDSAALTQIQNAVGRELPGVKIVTRRRVLDARQKTARSLARFGIALSIAVLLIAIVSVANQISSNVEDRRREIAIVGAIGADPSAIQRLLLYKALFVGSAGSTLGYLAGTALGRVLGWHLADLQVEPLTWLLPAGIIGITLLVLLASYLPVRVAVKTSPAETFAHTIQ